jgi:hypothetical protein
MAKPDSQQKQHSKTRRTDIVVFRTSPITCSMLLVSENEDFEFHH